MNLVDIFSPYREKILENFPEIKYSNLYKKVLANFFFEFQDNDQKYLFSPSYAALRGEPPEEFMMLVENNTGFFDSLKKFIIHSLFVYSALVEENSYYLTNPQSIIIVRLIAVNQDEFEIKFYTHYEDELQNSYNDKIYIGRDHIILDQFEREYLGLKSFYNSLKEQNGKIQERGKQKLINYNAYKRPFLDEIDYSVQEMVQDALERIELFPETKICRIPAFKINETLDNIFYLLNLTIELRELIREFEDALRHKGEQNFTKYLTKFSKDLKDGIRYLRKLSTYLHLRISEFPISKC